jgi:hypothetical protein
VSTLKVDTITKADGTGSLSVPAETGTVVTTASPSLGRRNLIINGAMQVAQRGTSFTGLTGGQYTLDRFYFNPNILGTWTASQDTDAPDAFGNSLKLACTTANASPSATAYSFSFQKFEGQNLQQLKKGTSSAESVTVSFWVKSNKTGDIQVNLLDNDNSRMVSSVVTINSSATWEHKTATFVGDTTGAFDNDNAASMSLEIWYDAGSNFTSGTANTSWATFNNTNRAAGVTLALGDSTSNYINITGVQLEVGSVATPFEHRSYGEELALCQRYYATGRSTLTFNGVSGRYVYKTIGRHNMRSAPTVTGSFASQGLGTVNSWGQASVNDNRQIYVQMAVGSGGDGDFTYYADAEL